VVNLNISSSKTQLSKISSVPEISLTPREKSSTNPNFKYNSKLKLIEAYKNRATKW
jgi:hypothetical protein